MARLYIIDVVYYKNDCLTNKLQYKTIQYNILYLTKVT